MNEHFSRFTEGARAVLSYGMEEAVQLGYRHIADDMPLPEAPALLGAAGWELAGVDTAGADDERSHSLYLFKRPLVG